jgi:ABC-type phosphate/phosphonate transport system substrate-binding protein
MRFQTYRPWTREHRLLFAITIVVLALVAILLVSRTAGAAEEAASPESQGLTIVVMDPLAKPLSCPCVQGYAQRDYDKLGERLQHDLGRPVKVVYNESLTTALKGDAKGRADAVIGKHSVVLFDAKRSGLKLMRIASLTGKDGATTQNGLIVVPKDDPAKSVADLKNYRIVFGPEECDEKYSAAMALLKENGIATPEKPETSPACSDGACSVLDEFKKDSSRRGAALISSYAKPLLEGCGTVEKGALKVVGETVKVPFIEAFVNEDLPKLDRANLAEAILKSTSDPLLRIALETKDGFVAPPKETVTGEGRASIMQVTPRIILSSDGSEENLLAPVESKKK